MLNLRPIFQDAIDVLSQFAAQLRVPALPPTVFLMQRDVVNHYRLAAIHYLPLLQNDYFLQNKSVEQWAKITNEDFAHFAFMLTNLMRYTTRLIHETESEAYRKQRRKLEASARSNAYIRPLMEIDDGYRQIGIRVRSPAMLTVTPFSTVCDFDGELDSRSGPDGLAEYFHTLIDPHGNAVNRAITFAEQRELTCTLRERQVSLTDRSVVDQLKTAALAECEELERVNMQFGKLCNAFCSQCEVATAFEQVHESWWL